MKKAVIAILAVLYVTVTSGITVNIHYCMGKLASVEYGYDDHDACGLCGMTEQREGCCHTEYKLVKVDDAHQLVPIADHNFQMPVAILPYEIVWIDEAPAKAVQISPSGNDPPDQHDTPVYLRNCVFRV
ncbi:hypothetical protein HHL16_14835 [Pseudoflavitalea sp. G-6-1-2]|uniref:HYC_CC_PP family protein n=1 Tax=Pseudoflavitalea sp. G-6-1-2 TaxID=2728841 RepID=UPI00146AFA9E|nr:hypothetical protein [Pseudoflavitalea sp. G-6-1-2]NML22156.1 hypothetical protein [Pseudoflavitalea sp. G-6-1-2]